MQSTNNSWAWDDIEINPFITDPEYLRVRHLLITAYDIDMLGNPVLAGPSDQRCALFSDDAQSGIITFAALARVASIGRKPSMGKIIQQSP